MRTAVRFFQEADGRCPVVEWLVALRRRDPRAYAKCAALIRRLEQSGHELRRPTAAFLRDGIHELRARSGRVNLRLLYFFSGRDIAILAHALTKEDVVPDADIERALRRKKAVELDPQTHTYGEP